MLCNIEEYRVLLCAHRIMWVWGRVASVCRVPGLDAVCVLSSFSSLSAPRRLTRAGAPAPARSGAGPVGCMVAGKREGTGAERVGNRELGAHALLSAPIYPSFEARDRRESRPTRGRCKACFVPIKGPPSKDGGCLLSIPCLRTAPPPLRAASSSHVSAPLRSAPSVASSPILLI